MPNRRLADIPLLLLASLVEKGVMFLLFAGMGWRFGAEAVGEYAFLFSVAWFLQNVMDLGGFSYQVPLLARQQGRAWPLWSMAGAKLVVFLLLLPGVTLFDRPERFLPLLLAMFLEGGVTLLRAWLHYHHRFARQAMAQMVEKGAVLAILVIAWVNRDLTLVYWSLATGKLAYFLFIALERGDLPPWERPPPGAALPMARESWSYILHAMATALFFQVDIILLKALGTPYAAIAWYAAATRILTALNAFPTAVQGAFYPALARALTQGALTTAWSLLTPFHRLFQESGAVVAVALMLMAPELAVLMFGPEFEETGRLLIFMAPLLLPRFSRTTSSSVLAASFHNQERLRGTVLATLIVVILLLLLAPGWQVWGAAYAAVLGEAVMSVLFTGSARLVLPVMAGMTGELLALAGLIVLGALVGENVAPAWRWPLAMGVVAIFLVRRARSGGLWPRSPQPPAGSGAGQSGDNRQSGNSPAPAP